MSSGMATRAVRRRSGSVAGPCRSRRRPLWSYETRLTGWSGFEFRSPDVRERGHDHRVRGGRGSEATAAGRRCARSRGSSRPTAERHSRSSGSTRSVRTPSSGTGLCRSRWTEPPGRSSFVQAADADADDGPFDLRIESAYATAWRRYFEQTHGFSVNESATDTANGTVVADLDHSDEVFIPDGAVNIRLQR